MERSVHGFVEQLGLPLPFDASQLRWWIEDHLRCRIEVQPHPMEGGLYGLCSPQGVCYVIYYRPDVEPWLQEHIVFHELGHILLGHVPIDGTMTACMKLVTTDNQDRLAEHFAEAVGMVAAYGQMEAPLAPASEPRTTFGRYVRSLRWS